MPTNPSWKAATAASWLLLSSARAEAPAEEPAPPPAEAQPVPEDNTPPPAVEPAPEAPPPAPPPFETWGAQKKNLEFGRFLNAVCVSWQKRLTLAGQHADERQRNDDAERPDEFLPTPVFHEVTGAFVFMKILDHSAGESLFAADDGAFVLRLSPGDSFRAYPGSRVQMTMHTKGERMRMTTGAALPVFLSGASPTTTRVIRGVHPDRAREKSLLKQLEQEKARALALLRKSSGPQAPDGTASLKRWKQGQVKWDVDADARVLIADDEGQPAYCVTLGLDCEGLPGEVINEESLCVDPD